MIKLKREMQSETVSKPEKYMPFSQASLNSDNCICVRNYNCEKYNDEIIILNQTETKAIIELFKILKQNEILPF